MKMSLESKLHPPEVSDYCFVLFDCKFENRIGCKVYGNGPVAVEWVEDVRMKMSPGILRANQGNYTTLLISRGLYPSIGDIIVRVGEMNVEHLTALEVRIVPSLSLSLCLSFSLALCLSLCLSASLSLDLSVSDVL
jgi:hypothetical protein